MLRYLCQALSTKHPHPPHTLSQFADMTTYETREAVAKLAEMDPELTELLNSGKPVGWVSTGLPVKNLEEAAVFLQSVTLPEPPSTPENSPLDIPVSGGRTQRARVYKAGKAAAGPAPLVVYVHGGGFVMGDPAHIALQARGIAEATGAVVVAPSYRLAPAHPFPAGQDDVWDAVNWLAQPENAASIGADPAAGFVVGGISAGGNLSAAAAQRYVSRGTGPKLTGVLLVVPYLLDESIVPDKYKPLWFSTEQNASAPIIDKETMDYVARETKFDFKSPLFSPFNDPKPHVGMPPVYIHAAGLDPLRDDALVYERALRDNGVKTRLDVYPGVPHGHAGMYPTLAASRKAELDLVKAAGWLLGKELTDEEAAKAVAAAATAINPATASAV